MSLRSVLVLALVALQLAVLGLPRLQKWVLAVRETSVARGERLAAELGCFTCHGIAGRGGVPNLPATTGAVPGFVRAANGLDVMTREERREFILDGISRAKREDPAYQERIKWTALRMPAYRAVVSEAELADLLAYLDVASSELFPTDPLARRGAELAERLACFDCHGRYGSGGRPNPGALKGYIPGFWGADFEDLVRDDRDLRGWIAAGEIDRIRTHPIGAHFLEQQRIKMPAFGQFLSEAELDSLVAYVRWLHGQGDRLEGSREGQS